MTTESLTVGPVTRVETLRREKGWRQLDLAAAAGVHATVVSRVESGLRPGASVRARLAQTLGVSEEELFPPGTALH